MARTRVNYGDYYADILPDWRTVRPYFVYVVQRQGSPEILAMGSCESEEEAVKFATDVIGQLRAKAASA